MSKLSQQLIEREKEERTGYLDLGNCGLRKLPDLSSLYWLETLVLSNMWWDGEQRNWIVSQNPGRPNRIAFPPDYHLPEKLKKLLLGGDPWNGRWTISSGRFLEKLTGLTLLDLRSNKFSDVRFLEKLTALTSLNLSGNQISNGSFFEKLPALTSLNLSHNQISNGEFLEKLITLTSIDLRNNRIISGEFLEKIN